MLCKIGNLVFFQSDPKFFLWNFFSVMKVYKQQINKKMPRGRRIECGNKRRLNLKICVSGNQDATFCVGYHAVDNMNILTEKTSISVTRKAKRGSDNERGVTNIEMCYDNLAKVLPPWRTWSA